MLRCDRRRFLQGLSAAGAAEFLRLTPLAKALTGAQQSSSGYQPAHIQNEYSLFLPGEREALASFPLVAEFSQSGVQLAGKGAPGPIHPGESADGDWRAFPPSWECSRSHRVPV